MTRLTTTLALIMAGTLGLSAMNVFAEEDAPAATEEAAPAQEMPEGHPPLPQGHPDISQMQKPKRFHGELPPGHPSIDAEPEEPKVYETTDVEPDWRVSMRHVIVRPMADQLHITEVWAITNPTEKSYVGLPAELFEDPVADVAVEAEGQPKLERVVMALPLPERISHVRAGGGFAPDAVVIKNGEVVSGAPMTPGTTQYRIGYLLASHEGVFTLPMASPRATDHAMVFLPDDGAEVTVEGLSAGDTFKAGDKVFRVYVGSKIEKDVEAWLTIEAQTPTEGEAVGAPASTGMSGAAAMPGSSGQTDPLKMIAGFGGGVLLLAAVILIFKPAKRQAATSVAL